MKILGTDFGLKYIIAEIDGNEYTISFRDTFSKGIYDVSVYARGALIATEVKSAYPGLFRRIQEGALLFCVELKNFIDRISKR